MFFRYFKKTYFQGVDFIITTIEKFGNSLVIIIPKNLLDELYFSENEVVKLKKFNGNILIKKVAKKYKNLDEVFDGYSSNYICSEYDFGENIW